MSGRVAAEGSRAARIVCIAEFPTDREIAIGRPLIGPTGQLWMRWLDAAGIRRSDLWIDNVYPFQAPGNKIANVDKREVALWIENLHERIAELADPWVIVPMGNLAVKALLGESSISKWRGSIREYVDRKGRRIKVIPTIHPAAIFRDGNLEKRCRRDWIRIADDATFRELRLPARDHRIRPTLGDLRDFVRETAHADCVAIDIETPRTRQVTVPTFTWACWGCGESGSTFDAGGFNVNKLVVPGTKRMRKAILHRRRDGAVCGPVGHEAFTGAMKPRVVKETVTYGPRRITCVGFSHRPDVSLTIPTTLAYWRDERLLREAWATIRTLCESPAAKVLQNGHFDTFYLALDHGIHLRNWVYDTMCQHHVLDPVEDHDLAFMTSVDTREPHYKADIKATLDDDDDDAEEEFDEQKREHDFDDIEVSQDVYWTYNGKDAAVTRELCDVYVAELAKRKGASDRYHAYYVSRFPALFRMMTKGTRYDRETAAVELATLEAAIIRTRAEIDVVCKADLFGEEGGISTPKLMAFLYGTLRLPAQTIVDPKTKKRKPTTREVALRTLAVKYPERCGEQIRLILEYRKAAKLRMYFNGALADADGYVRCSYRFTTEQMRLSSSKNPRRTGTNLQNQPPAARKVYLPDPGHVWLKLDLSQVESRIFDVLSKHPEHIERARAKPWEFDAHADLATRIFGRFITKADKAERQVGKTTRHMVQGGAGAARLADVLMKAGIVRSIAQCAQYIARTKIAEPGIDILHADIRRRLLRDRKLVNVWGDEWGVPYERLDDELFRRGYRFGPQSNNARLLDLCGLVPMTRYIKASGMEARVLVQVHDELGFSVAPAAAWELYSTAKKSLERSVDYEGVSLSVPVEVGVGRSWGTVEEFKRPPSREEFEAAIASLVVEAKEQAA